MSETNTRYRINEPDVTAEAFEDEVIVINLANGHYHSIRGLGTWLWHALAAGTSRQEALECIGGLDGAEPEAVAEAEAFVDQLITAELLVVARDGDGEVGCLPPKPAVLQAPLLQTFTDMEHLLLIDPIHEVGVQGWPHTPESAG